MAVKQNELDSVKKKLADFRSRDLLSPAAGDIQAFTLSERNKDKVTRGRVELKKGSEERWIYVQPPYGDAQATGADPAATDKPPSNVQSVLTDISNLKVASDTDFVKDDAKISASTISIRPRTTSYASRSNASKRSARTTRATRRRRRRRSP